MKSKLFQIFYKKIYNETNKLNKYNTQKYQHKDTEDNNYANVLAKIASLIAMYPSSLEPK